MFYNKQGIIIAEKINKCNLLLKSSNRAKNTEGYLSDRISEQLRNYKVVGVHNSILDFAYETAVDFDYESIRHIKHIWLDGKVVPWTDELALAQARGHKFVPGVREPRFWMIVAGLAMIAAGLFIKIKRYLNKQRNE